MLEGRVGVVARVNRLKPNFCNIIECPILLHKFLLRKNLLIGTVFFVEREE